MDTANPAPPRVLGSLEDCRLLVNTFYMRVRRDPLLGPVFASRIADEDWPEHLERMAAFWYTVLFSASLYHGNPREKHAGLSIDGSHFERWLVLWTATLEDLFVGARADEAKARAARMAQVLSRSVGLPT